MCWSLPIPTASPHEDDEVYVVLEGSGMLEIER
jgi:mannose-6-phosphate isomerase-like protein (cupin superfamily)